MYSKIPNGFLKHFEFLNKMTKQHEVQFELAKIQIRNNQLSNSINQLNVIGKAFNNGIGISAKPYNMIFANFKNPIFPTVSVYETQINTIKPLIPNIKVWDDFFNLAVSTYQNSQEEEFEIEIESIPVTINKTKLQEYIEVFQKLEIPKNVSIYLGISSYILLWLSPYTVFFPSLEPGLWEILKWIFEVLKSFGIVILEYTDPKKFAELTFTIAAPVFANFIFNKFSKK